MNKNCIEISTVARVFLYTEQHHLTVILGVVSKLNYILYLKEIDYYEFIQTVKYDFHESHYDELNLT